MKLGIRWIDKLMTNSRLGKLYDAKILKKRRMFRKKYFQYINELRVLSKLPNEY